jgi:hypothetical protein
MKRFPPSLGDAPRTHCSCVGRGGAGPWQLSRAERARTRLTVGFSRRSQDGVLTIVRTSGGLEPASAS